MVEGLTLCGQLSVLSIFCRLPFSSCRSSCYLKDGFSRKYLTRLTPFFFELSASKTHKYPARTPKRVLCKIVSDCHSIQTGMKLSTGNDLRERVISKRHRLLHPRSTASERFLGRDTCDLSTIRRPARSVRTCMVG